MFIKNCAHAWQRVNSKMCSTSPQGQATLVTWLSVALVGISSALIAQSCAVQHQTGRLDCPRELVGLHSKWFNAFIICVIGGFFTAVFLCIAHNEERCGSRSVRIQQTIAASFASACCVSIYAHFAYQVLESTPAPHVGYSASAPAVCVVCAQSGNSLYYSVMMAGVATSWLGVCTVGYTGFITDVARDKELTQRLTSQPNDLGRTNDGTSSDA
jgi:hypothetical protein